MTTVIYPGSFDPFTKGHEHIVKKACNIFDTVVVAIGNNSFKKYIFHQEERIEFIHDYFKDYEFNSKIIIGTFDGLLVDYCSTYTDPLIIRGLRNSQDFENEKSIAIVNKKLSNIETMFLTCDSEFSHISSSVVKELIKHRKRDHVLKVIGEYVSDMVVESIRERILI